MKFGEVSKGAPNKSPGERHANETTRPAKIEWERRGEGVCDGARLGSSGP